MPELENLPPGEGPTTLPRVKARLRIPDEDTRDDDELLELVGAVNAQVRAWPVSAAAVGLETWPDHIAAGARMLVCRLYRRRNSPAGVEAFGEAGAVYVMRQDPDIAMLLKLGPWQRPAVG